MNSQHLTHKESSYKAHRTAVANGGNMNGTYMLAFFYAALCTLPAMPKCPSLRLYSSVSTRFSQAAQ